jgi:hypothetical protein
LLTGSEGLNPLEASTALPLGLLLGDPDDEVLGAWLTKEYGVTSISPRIPERPPVTLHCGGIKWDAPSG